MVSGVWYDSFNGGAAGDGGSGFIAGSVEMQPFMVTVELPQFQGDGEGYVNKYKE